MLLSRNKVFSITNIFYDNKEKCISTITVISILKMRIVMLACLQIFKMLILSSVKINRTAYIKIPTVNVDYSIYARAFRDLAMLKVSPPVLLVLRRDWIYMKNNIIHGLMSKCV